MDKNFVKILEKVVKEIKKKEAKAISNNKLWKSLLDDFALGEYKQEIEWLLSVIGKNVHLEIYKAVDLKVCKLKQIRIIQEQLRWSEADAVDMVDTLAELLKSPTIDNTTEIKKQYIIKLINLIYRIQLSKGTIQNNPQESSMDSVHEQKLIPNFNPKRTQHNIVPEMMNSNKTYQVGEIITFGAYQWLVLEVQNDRALILSRDIVEQRKYREDYVAKTWAKCSLRTYLNNQFYNSFNATDKDRIIQVNNINENNQWFKIEGGLNTSDYIFLLSIAEVVKYFDDSGLLKNKNHDYWIDDKYNSARIANFKGSVSFWWLRSPGSRSHYAAIVNHYGMIDMIGGDVNSSSCGVRPALWLHMESKNLQTGKHLPQIKEKVVEATNVIQEIDTVITTNIIVKPKEKSIITFGDYEWLVLEVENDRALLLSKYFLEKRAYHKEGKDITYENCSLRTYLNGGFYNSFSNADKSRILSVVNTNENNQWYGTSGGASTNDRIFLLSVSEVVKYFGDSGQLKNRPSKSTYYISDKFNSERIASLKNEWASCWWLRSLGDYSLRACYVTPRGEIHMDGYIVHSSGVRPALWLKI